MKTDREFFQDHRGHELEVEDGSNKTPHVFFMGLRKPGKIATAECPLCEVEEEVELAPDVICLNHPRGELISIVCTNCGETGRTKNIKFIGARSLHISCTCDNPDIQHNCSVSD